MKADYFQSLKSIIVSLKPEEVEVAKKFLVAFDKQGKGNGQNKSLQLFKLVHRKPDISFGKALSRISPTASAKSFERTAMRLRDRLLESLLLHINTVRKTHYCELFRVQLKLRKSLMQVPVLFDRGIYDEATEQRDRVVAEAKRYELYDELVEALQHKVMAASLQLRNKDYDLATRELRIARLTRRWVNEAEQQLRNLELQRYNGSSANRSETIALVLHRVTKMYRITRSVRIHFCKLSLTRELAALNQQAAKATETGRALANLVRTQPALAAPEYSRHYQAGSAMLELVEQAREAQQRLEKLAPALA